MKSTAAVGLVGFLLCCCCLAYDEVPPGYHKNPYNNLLIPGVEPDVGCKCMNWRNCNGTIDNTQNCHPSYIFVCCKTTTDSKNNTATPSKSRFYEALFNNLQ